MSDRLQHKGKNQDRTVGEERGALTEAPAAEPAFSRPAGIGAGLLQRKLQRRAALRARATEEREEALEIAESGVSGGGGALPHLDRIQAAFGPEHDIAGVRAHVGGAAGAASDAIGAAAYATGNSVAFRDSPDLHLAAHEAAHVVQQRAGVQLAGGVGAEGDAYERHADQVADAVARGESAAPLLARLPSGGVPAAGAQRQVQRQEAPQQGNQGDAARSVGDHAARSALHEAALREMYHAGERAIGAEAELMLRAGKSEAEVARWASEARNALRRAIREQGEPIVDAIARATRGARDMPGYEQLRAAGKTDAQIIQSATRSNVGVDRWAGRLRIAGRILIAIDIGVAVYHVASAPEVDRPRVLAHEVGRLGGALAGGWAGAKGGAALGGAIGSLFPGAGTAIGAGIGGVVGGIGGALAGGWAGGQAGDWVIDQLYPPAQTRFEPNQ